MTVNHTYFYINPGNFYKNMYLGITDLVEIGKIFGNFKRRPY
jgi:hypothetical protein